MEKRFTAAAFIAILVVMGLSPKPGQHHTGADDPIKEIIRRIVLLESQVSKLDEAIGSNRKGVKSQLSTLQSALRSNEKGIAEQLADLRAELQTQTETVNKQMVTLKEDMVYKSLPAGSIVAFARDESQIPAGWVLCDGRRINDPNSAFNNAYVPDLVASFIRGKARNEALYATGGKDEISGHRHTVSSHTHEVGNHTHNFTTNSVSITGNWSCNYGYGVQFTQGGKIRYILGGDTEAQYTENSSHYHSGTTGNASDGYTGQGGGGTTGYSPAETNIPGYVALYYIIKIK